MISTTTTCPGCALPRASGRDHQILVDPPVLGLDEPDAALLVDASDDLAIRALEHIDDLAFGPPAPVEAHALGA